MADEIVIQPQPRAWLESSILRPYVSAYGEHLCPGRSRSTAWWSRRSRSEMARSQEARHLQIIVVAPTGFYSSDRRHASARHTLSYFEAPAA